MFVEEARLVEGFPARKFILTSKKMLLLCQAWKQTFKYPAYGEESYGISIGLSLNCIKQLVLFNIVYSPNLMDRSSQA